MDRGRGSATAWTNGRKERGTTAARTGRPVTTRSTAPMTRSTRSTQRRTTTAEVAKAVARAEAA
eukprot:8909238-Pyramimonas_sp.AAC.1